MSKQARRLGCLTFCPVHSGILERSTACLCAGHHGESGGQIMSRSYWHVLQWTKTTTATTTTTTTTLKQVSDNSIIVYSWIKPILKKQKQIFFLCQRYVPRWSSLTLKDRVVVVMVYVCVWVQWYSFVYVRGGGDMKRIPYALKP